METDLNNEAEVKRFTCQTCFKTFTFISKSYFIKHCEICGKGDFTCPVCRKRFFRKPLLKKHMKCHDKNYRKHRCMYCSHMFPSQWLLNDHVKKVHGTESNSKNFKCKYCPKEFKWRCGLSRHLGDAHCSDSLAYQCACGISFPSYFMSYRHKKQCEKYLEKKIQLNPNVNLEVSNTKVEVDDKEKVVQGRNNYKCQLCHRLLSSRPKFEKHVERCDPFTETLSDESDSENDCENTIGSDLAAVESSPHGKEMSAIGVRADTSKSSDHDTNVERTIKGVSKCVSSPLGKEMYTLGESADTSKSSDHDTNAERTIKSVSKVSRSTESDDEGEKASVKQNKKEFLGHGTSIGKKEEETCFLRKRSTRKRKMKDFSDFETEFDLSDTNSTQHKQQVVMESVEENFKVIKVEDSDVESQDLSISPDNRPERTNNSERAEYPSVERDTRDNKNTGGKTGLKQTMASGTHIQHLNRQSKGNRMPNRHVILLTTPVILNSDVSVIVENKKYRSILPKTAQKATSNKVEIAFFKGEGFETVKKLAQNLRKTEKKNRSLCETLTEQINSINSVMVEARKDDKNEENLEEDVSTCNQWSDNALDEADEENELHDLNNEAEENEAAQNCESLPQLDNTEKLTTITSQNKTQIEVKPKIWKKKTAKSGSKEVKSNKRVRQCVSDVDNSKSFLIEKIAGVDFQCCFDLCGQILPNYFVWKKHKLEHDPASKTEFTCGECSFTSAAEHKYRWKEHILVKHHGLGKVPVNLKFCQFLAKTTQQPVTVFACTFCGFIMDSANFTAKHTCFRASLKYYCIFCSVDSEDFDFIQQHIEKDHSDKKIYNSIVTDKFQTLRTSMLDPASHVPDDAIECRECSRTFDTNKELKLHVNAKHAIFPYCCGVCRQSYGRRNSLKEHFKKTHVLQFQCEKCGKGFGDRNDHDRHVATHQSVKPFKCQICDNRYADEKSMKVHIERVHRDDSCQTKSESEQPGQSTEMLVCEQCGLTFQTSSQLKRHVLRHEHNLESDTGKTCEICSKTFKKSTNFKNHICLQSNELITGIEIDANSDDVNTIKDLCGKIGYKMSSGQVKCTLCNKVFKRKKYMYGHIKRFHLQNDGKKHHCHLCNKGFERQFELNSHLRVHSNSKPYRCRICGKTFRQIAHIREHLLSHGNFRQFTCKLCLESYACLSGLKNHVLKHCLTKPFKCVVSKCEEKFSALNQVLAHLRRCYAKHKDCILKCTLCPQAITNFTSGLKHLVLHRKDEVYTCGMCPVTCTTYYKLYCHKAENDHFTLEERQAAEKVVSAPRNKPEPKSIMGDISHMNREELQKQYDFIPDDTVGNKDSRTKTDIFSEMQEVPFTDIVAEQIVDDAETEKGTNTNLLDIASHLASINTQGTLLDENDFLLPDTAETVLEGDTTGRETKVDVKELPQESLVLPKELPKNETYVGRSTMSCLQNTAKEILAIAGNDVRSTNSSFSPQEKLVSETKVKQLIEEKASDEPVNILLSQEVLCDAKLVHKSGKEVVIKYVNEFGQQLPIVNNLELLQSLLNTGDYYLKHDALNLDGEMPVLAVDENQIIEEETDHKCAIAVAEDDKNKNTEIQELEYVENRADLQSENITRDTGRMKRAQNALQGEQLRNHKQQNADKVCGEIADNDLRIGYVKSEGGQVNYKIRLNYYEDRSELDDRFPFQCETCQKRFRRVKDLNSHKKVHLPSSERPYQCSECGKGYTSKAILENHMRVHTGSKPFKCEECGKSFRQLGQLQVHVRRHTGYKPFKCSECDSFFSTNSALKVHIRKHKELMQSVKGSVTCEVCHEMFLNRKQLLAHLVQHMGAEDQVKLLQGFVNTDDKSLLKQIKTKAQKAPGNTDEHYMCDQCGKKFAQRYLLYAHLQKHKDGASLQCDECKQSYNTEYNLRMHKNNVHSTAALYQCHICGLSLKKTSFRAHMERHNQPEFYCSKCGENIKGTGNFVAHAASCIKEDFVKKLSSLTSD